MRMAVRKDLANEISLSDTKGSANDSSRTLETISRSI